MQKKNLIAHTVTVKLRWADFTTITRQKSVNVGIDNEEEILFLATVLWRSNWSEEQHIRLLGVGVSNLVKGGVADVTCIDLERQWTVDPEAFKSKGRNSPFRGFAACGKAVMTIVGGRIAHAEGGADAN